ncbi:phenylacetate 2-hydroxylase [Metschnikowia aff. pulcherrima]|uniref:Phenylacetate 2-hydroxylase n=1 Tax=Metschnikowia aff. pulcherrima TaxID=2163413 RepID=A0A4P6XLK9_9ASCO|nr:phenylacetate 2-hydroxylase [Metschnikowia aff. pulcherrima]
MLLATLLLVIFFVLYGIRYYYLKRRLARQRIIGAFVIPGYPFVGNAFQVLKNPSKVFIEWSEKYSRSTYVVYLGQTPVVIVNSRRDIECLWSFHSTSLNSRPTLHTFHKIVSSSQGPTVGTTPAGPSFRKKRKTLSLFLSSKSLTSTYHLYVMDDCSRYTIKSMLLQVADLSSRSLPILDVSLIRHFQCFVLRCAILLTYGVNLDTHGNDKQLADRIIETENHIINFRSFISNYQDYLPIFRVYPFSKFVSNDAQYWRLERDKYIERLQDLFEEQSQADSLPSSESLLAQIRIERSIARRLTSQEARSLCLTMLSAGLDNLGFTLNFAVGQLSCSKNGYKLQDKLYNELLTKSKGDIMRAWLAAASQVDCDFALAIIHEALRNFSVLPLGLPRLTTKPIQFGQIHIPTGTVLLMNVFAANHDSRVCQNPESFQPQRWLDNTGKFHAAKALNHFSFGLGSRKCAGDQLSVKEMYTLLCRLVLVFHIRLPQNLKWLMEPDPFLSNSKPAATSFEPREFRVWLKVRQGDCADELCESILKSL